MRRLLESIEGLKKSEIRTLVDSRIKEFKENRGKPTEEIFKELCFCILCANYNAERSIRIQREVSEGFITLGRSALARRLRRLGHRFPNTRAKYIVKAREHKDSLKDIIKSSNDANELREWLAQNVMGIGYKEASLPDYEKVMVVSEGKVETVKIGDLYREHGDCSDTREKLKTFSFDPETLKLQVVPITKIYRHEYRKDLYEIYLERGRRVSVTGDHSVFSIGCNGIVPVEVRTLKKGDFIAVPRRLPTLNPVQSHLNLVQEFIGRNIDAGIYLKSKEYCDFLRENYRQEIVGKGQSTQHPRGAVPISVVASLPREAYGNNVLKRFRVEISLRTSGSVIESVIELDRDFFWVLGVLTARATIRKNAIEITLGIEEYDRFERLNRLLSTGFGLKVNENYPKGRKVYTLKINNLLFFHLIRDVFGIRGFSRTKMIPRIVFSTSSSNILSFLQGYSEGDGRKRSKQCFSVQTHSAQLAEDLLLLLLMVGVSARITGKESRGYKIGTASSIDYGGGAQSIQLKYETPISRREVIPNTGEMVRKAFRKLGIRTRIGGRRTDLYQKVMRWKHVGHTSREGLNEFLAEARKHGNCLEAEKLKMMVDSDLSFSEILKTRKVPYGGNYVYDLEVAQEGNDFRNFVGGIGGVCLHNSHFLRNIGEDNCAILDFHIIDIMTRCGLVEKPRTLTKKKYLEIEEALRKIALKTRLTLSELDLYLWYMETGKVLK